MANNQHLGRGNRTKRLIAIRIAKGNNYTTLELAIAFPNHWDGMGRGQTYQQ
jgi:hypothetical protein